MDSELNIKMLSSTEYESNFILEHSTPAIANKLRKHIMSNIPVFAIDTIEFIDNTSVLINDQIIQRLSYIPIVSSIVDDFNVYNECPCDKDCEKCSISFYINVTNNTPEPLEVSSFDIHIDNPNVTVYSDSKYSIPITRLTQNQTCHIRGKIKKGKGSQHSKWSPVGTVSYKFLPQFTFKRKLTSSEKEKLVRTCPMGVFKQVDDIEDLHITESKCTVCNECVYVFPDAIHMDFKTDSAVFKLESVGQLTVEEIMNRI
jgi:DNA-directed RNA polymerase subunit D